MFKVLPRDLRVLIAQRYLDHFDRCVLRIALGSAPYKRDAERAYWAAERGYDQLMKYFWDGYNNTPFEAALRALRGNQVHLAAIFGDEVVKRQLPRVRLTDDIICKFKHLLKGYFTCDYQHADLFQQLDIPLLQRHGIRVIETSPSYGGDWSWILEQN